MSTRRLEIVKGADGLNTIWMIWDKDEAENQDEYRMEWKRDDGDRFDMGIEDAWREIVLASGSTRAERLQALDMLERIWNFNRDEEMRWS